MKHRKNQNDGTCPLRLTAVWTVLFAALVGPLAADAGEIHRAARDGDAEEVARLLSAEGVSADERDRTGYTALHWAVQAGHVETARVLVEAGADVDAEGGVGGTTPLQMAQEARNGEMEAFLKENGASFRQYRASVMANPLALVLSPLIGLLVQGEVDLFLSEHFALYGRGAWVSINPDSLAGAGLGIMRSGWAVNVGARYYAQDYAGFTVGGHLAFEYTTFAYSELSESASLLGVAAVVGHRWNFGALTLTPIAQFAVNVNSPGRVTIYESSYATYYADFPTTSFGWGLMIGIAL